MQLFNATALNHNANRYKNTPGKSAEHVRAKPFHLLMQTALPLESPTGAFIAAQTRIFPGCFFADGDAKKNGSCNKKRRCTRSASSPASVTFGDSFPQSGKAQNLNRFSPVMGSYWRSTVPSRTSTTISQVALTTARFRCPPNTSPLSFPALMCRWV